MQRYAYYQFAQQVRQGIEPSPKIVENLASDIHRLTQAQLGAVTAFIELAPSAINSKAILLPRLLERPESEQLLPLRDAPERIRRSGIELVSYLLQVNEWRGFAISVADNSADDVRLGYILGAITLGGLDEASTTALTIAMKESGAQFDYRSSFPNDVLIRRYPTGALSEKVALIMPIVISALRYELNLPVLSPFIVAKTFGHTGGTWDKLQVVPGFTFPKGGSETQTVLDNCGVAYSVTIGDYNPADRRIYALRNETNTIESPPLIVSSIASKMLACPVQLMQLDVRYGPGSFFPSREAGSDIGRKISSACSTGGMQCFYTLTDTFELSGTSIGCLIEVVEAIEVLGGGATRTFDERGVALQRHIVASFVARLISEVSSRDKNFVYDCISSGFQNGRFQTAFARVLRSHGVSSNTIEQLWKTPRSLLARSKVNPIISKRSGRLDDINQRVIGTMINGSGASLQLRVGPADQIKEGDVLAELMTLDTPDNDMLSELRDALNII